MRRLGALRRRRAEKREKADAEYERAVTEMASRIREIVDGVVESMASTGAAQVDVKVAPGMPGGIEVSLNPSRPEAASVWAYPDDYGLDLLVANGEQWIPAEDGWQEYFATLIRAVIDGRYREEYVITQEYSGAVESITMLFELPSGLVKVDAGKFPTTSVVEGSGERRYAAYR